MKSIYRLSTLLLMSVVALGALSCDNDGDDVQTVPAPTISIEEAILCPDDMVAQITIIPSSDTEAWYWKIERTGENIAYNKVDSAAGAIIEGKVEYGVEYTVSAYAENEGGRSNVATKKFCFLPEEAADIIIGEVALDPETMRASATMYPSSMTEKWYWRAYDATTTAPAWNDVVGNSEQKIEFDYIYGKNYILETYAEHVGGKSDVHQVEVYFEPDAATIELSEAIFNEETMSVSFNVTPSQETAVWGWSVNGAEPTTVEGNAPNSFTFDVEYDTEYSVTVFAENVVGKGESKSVKVKYDAPILEPLVSIAIENLTAYTLDAVVTKADHCVRYVAGAIHSDAYDRDTFIEQALSSLSPDESYPLMVFNTATESRTFSEQDLVRNTKVDSNDNAGIILMSGVKYTIAVYGEDEKGRSDVYTYEVTIPEAEINGDVDVNITIDESGETSAAMTVTADTECKMLIGYMPYSSNSDGLIYDFGTMSNDEICEYIAQNSLGIPAIYKEPISRRMNNLALDSKFMAYAIAIKDGKVGKIAFKEFETKTSSLRGTAKITAATIEEQKSYETLNVTLTADDNARKVRLYAAPSADHISYADNLEYVMGSDTYQNYREEYTYDTAAGSISINIDIHHPGDKYYLYAVAVDEAGEAGEMVCVAQLAGFDTEYYQTIEETTDSNITLGGTGEVKLTAEVTLETADQIDANIRVKFLSTNIEKVCLYRINEGKTENIRDHILTAYANYPSIDGAKQEVKDGDTKAYQYMIPYSETYGGTIVIAVVLDTDGKFNISYCYVAGKGVQEL